MKAVLCTVCGSKMKRMGLLRAGLKDGGALSAMLLRFVNVATMKKTSLGSLNAFIEKAPNRHAGSREIF